MIEINDSKYIHDNNFMSDFLQEEDINNDLITPDDKDYLKNSKKKEIIWDLNQDYYEDNEITIGNNVYHQKYGNGKILDLDGDKAIVDFDNFSSKKIYIKFLKVIY